MENSKRALILIIWSLFSAAAIIGSINYSRFMDLVGGEPSTLGIGVFVWVGGSLAAAIILMKKYW